MASSLEEGASPFIKQTSEWAFVDQVFWSSSPGRAFLTPEHAGATLP